MVRENQIEIVTHGKLKEVPISGLRAKVIAGVHLCGFCFDIVIFTLDSSLKQVYIDRKRMRYCTTILES